MEFDRLCGTMPGDPNIYGSLLAVGLVVTLLDAEATLSGRAARASILAAALVATGSRSGGLAAIVGLTVAILVRSRDVWVTLARGLAVGAAAAVVATLFLMTDAGQHATAGVAETVGRASTVESRLEFYARALEQFAESPITGLGIGGFHDLNSWGTADDMGHFAVHNTYIWALVDLGVGGAVLLVALIIAAIRRALGAAHVHGHRSDAAIVVGALCGIAVFNLFVDGLYQRQFWVLVACAMALPAMRRARAPLPLVARRRGAATMSYAEAR
jgi:O-antigen ligase